jgi:hypothetical protein
MSTGGKEGKEIPSTQLIILCPRVKIIHPIMSGSSSESVLGFLRLPIEIRNDIYQRVLTLSNPLYLFQDPGSRVETFSPEIHSQWLAFLYINRQIYYEARAVLYGRNHFTLMEVEIAQHRSSLLKSFINTIGPLNAGFLSHISISFPATENRKTSEDQPGKIRLREDSLQSLQLLQTQCTRLRTLETLVSGKNYTNLIKADNQFAREALSEVNAQFRGIASLNKIIVRIYSGTPSPSTREFMQGLGWVVLLSNRS